jgi:thioredoxin reductase (NADPH)
MTNTLEETAFPTLDAEEMESMRRYGTVHEYADGAVIFKAGDASIDLVVVESGMIDIINPTDENRVIASHTPGAFAGDIDVLTRRPVIVTAIARGPTRVIRITGPKLRELVTRLPRLGETLLNAFIARREVLTHEGNIGLRVIGPGRCRDTAVVREFLYKNFVPFTWYDTQTDEGKMRFEKAGSPRKTPVIECGGGQVLLNPTLPELARAAGIWNPCPAQTVDFVIIGAGPAGLAAAVYAASEGVSTLVLDQFGPGGQAGGSSKIENFIGFPSGLSGAELATRGVLQLLKFGAKITAPVTVKELVPPETPGGYHDLHLDCGSTVRARTVLVATGVAWRKLEAQGADQFERAGVYYACTSVEALLYDKCHVAVVGAGNSAGQAAMYLSECCRDRTVHMLVRNKLGPGMSSYLANRIRAAANIVVHEGVEIACISGSRRVEKVHLKNKDGSPGQTLDLEAVFVFIGAEPGARWLPQSVTRDSQGYVLTGVDALRSGHWPSGVMGRDPVPLETTVPGLLAGGDIRSGSTKRVGFAVGDGSLAVTCVHKLAALSPASAAVGAAV